MLLAQFLKHLGGQLCAPGFHVLIALPDTFYCFLEVSLFPLNASAST
jgi:hypothetical protein